MAQSDLLARAQHVLAGGPATLSKHWQRFPQGIAPSFLAQGDGVTVWDVEGRAYLDCIGALGAILLGHCHPAVMTAVRQQVGLLVSSSLSTYLEVDVAERLIDVIPGAEQVRFASNGKDVTEAAVKLARCVTGKQHVIYIGYHGGFSDYLITTDKCGGILPQIQPYNHQITWRDEDTLGDLLDTCHKDLAAIIVEVPPEPSSMHAFHTTDMLQKYKDYAHAFDALFILDEIVTWGRYGMGGAQSYYGIQADLVCLSKALGNGLPIAALAGPHDVMQAFDGGNVFLSTTFGGNPLSLAACKAVLQTLPSEYDTLETHGGDFLTRLVDAFSLWHMPATIRGMHGRIVIDWQACNGVSVAQLKTLWMQEMLRRGVLVSVAFLPMTCWRHETVETLLRAVEATCAVIADVLSGKKEIHEALECSVIEESFQRERTPA